MVRPHRRDLPAGSGLTVDNAGTRRFARPGKNGDGDPDWVLVLTAA